MALVDGVDARVETFETFEDDALVLVGDASAEVLYGNVEQVVVNPALDDDFAVLVAVFDSVVEDVGDNLLKFLGVGVEIIVLVAEAELNLIVELDVDTHLACDDGERVNDTLDKLADVDFLDVGQNLAGLDFGSRENVFELEVEVERLIVDEGDHGDYFLPVLLLDGEDGL